MIKKNPWIFAVATLTVGAAGGYISGKGSDSGAASVVENQANSRTRSSSRTEGSAAESTKKATRATSAEQIARLPGNSNRIKALMDFYAGLSTDKLAEEAAKLENLPMDERITASILLFGRWAEVDPTAAMAFSNTMGMAGGFVRPTILKSWASVDPASAAKYYAANPREFAMMGMFGSGGGGRGMGGGQGAASIIAGEWARQDPAAAMAWASSLTTDKEQTMTAVIGEVAKSDPRTAAELIGKMDAAERAGAYRSVAVQYGALDFSEAQTWIRTLPADQQANALASAINGLSGTDPAAAVKQLATMEAGDPKDRLIPDVVGNLARKDPQAAADLLQQQDSEQAQRDGMRQLMPALVAKDAISALAYAQSFPAGPVQDSAIQSYLWNDHTTPPVDLMKVAESISDDGSRNRAIGMTAMQWMKLDPTAAKDYINSSALPDEQKQRIISGQGIWGGGGNRGGN
jgi:hypothetical protein